MKKKSQRGVQSPSPTKRARLFRAGLFACVMLGAGVVTAIANYEPRGSEPARASSRSAPPAQAGDHYVTVEVGGRRLQVNAKTLQQGPLTQEQAQALADSLKDNKSTDGLVQKRQKDGTVSMDLEDRFQNVTMAKKNDDGTISAACVDTPEAARAFLQRRDRTEETPIAGARRKAASKE